MPSKKRKNSNSPLKSGATKAPRPANTTPPLSPRPGPSNETPAPTTSASLSSPLLAANPFSVLTPEDTLDETQKKKEEKPPPIFIRNVSDYITFLDSLYEELGGDFTCKCRTKDVVLHTTTSDSYRKAISYLKNMGAEYHTFQLKEEKSLRAVIRFLHHTTPTEKIKAELESLGFEVRGVSNALNHTTKEKLPLFFVDLKPNNKSKEIFELTRLLRTVVRVEEPHKKRIIPQCQRCQAYGHTRGYCNLQPKCVKCAGSHLSSECLKTRDSPAKCALCNGAHPANYRGCSTYEALKRKVNHPAPKHLQPTPVAAPPAMESTSQFPSLQPECTQPTHVLPDPSTSEDRPSYASVIGHRRQLSQVTQPTHIPPPPTNNDISSLLQSFLNDFQQVMKPLFSLLTEVMSAVIPLLRKIP